MRRKLGDVRLENLVCSRAGSRVCAYFARGPINWCDDVKRVWIGCSGWNYPHWRGTVYPRGLPARRWLEHYVTLFNTVEVNYTFYRLPSPSAVESWVKQTPPDFLFTVKASRFLTHMKRLTDMGVGLERFYERIEPLIESSRLGPVLWQLPERFRRDDERLAFALERLPPGRHCFEFRHQSRSEE